MIQTTTKFFILFAISVSTIFPVDQSDVVGSWLVNKEQTNTNYRKTLSDMLLAKAKESGLNRDEKTLAVINKETRAVIAPDMLLNCRFVFRIDGSATSDCIDGTSRDDGTWTIEGDMVVLQQPKNSWKLKLVDGRLVPLLDVLNVIVLERNKD
jgi:hypothetical protein